MYSALTASTLSDHLEETQDTPSQRRHLQAVEAPPLQIGSAAILPATRLRQAARPEHVPLDPREEFAPAQEVGAQRGRSNVFTFRSAERPQPVDHQHAKLLADIKKVTQAVGSAFIEAELGIRSFGQLSSWLEFDLFHKLKARVYHSANAKHVAARRGEASRKVPSVKTIGVRAAMHRNGEWESSMTIRVGKRARAIAMRIQLHRDRWRVIALEVG
ncbi:hypothetical protein GCM10023190_07920 [Enteractinococcus fodinae]|uniref:Uncharacterized protein n=1 Tax=Enteractinococcus fodinae TaxID=684663 RepID=A0ABU2AZG3_9MICC|nr:Rv3235 family protein [Enteractinococcus fodinae]MDR7346731.1 hypothetical protein [Enteractinococcus fodinae]